jgi:hypothetical protein
MDGIFFKGDRGNWASINTEEIAEKMKLAFDNYDRLLTQVDPATMRKTFTWKNSAQKAINAIKHHTELDILCK